MLHACAVGVHPQAHGGPRGQHALALSRASSGPGLRVSFRLDAEESHRLKWFIRDLLELYYLGEQYEFLNSFFLDQDEFRADAAVELQDAWCGRLVTRWGQVRRHVTMRGVVSLILSREKVFNYWTLRLRAAMSLHVDSAPLWASLGGEPFYFESRWWVQNRVFFERLLEMELCRQNFCLIPVDFECNGPHRSIDIRSGTDGGTGFWSDWCPLHGEIPQELLAVIRSLAAGDQVRFLLVQRGVMYF